MGIAFFDLDKTLLSENSGSLWIKKELAEGHITRWQAFQASVWIVRYHLGFAALESALERAVRMLAGIPEKDIRDRTVQFYEGVVRPLFRPMAMQTLEEHRRRGDKLVLLTSSSIYMAELVARDLQLDEVLCNRFEVDENGLHTGRPLGHICFGPGKLKHAEEYAKSVGVPLADASFYTDSFSDVSVMYAVGNPVAVNPDHRLRREAVRRGWKVVDWAAPALAHSAAGAHP